MRVVYLPVAVVETLEGLEQVFNMALHKVPKWRREQQEEAWQLHCVAVTRPYRMKYIDDLREIADAARVYGPRYWTDQRARELVAKMLLERLGLVIPVGLTVLDYLPVTHSDKDALSWVS